MSMNSFSFKAAQREKRKSQCDAYEDEISGLLELHRDGDVFPFPINGSLQIIPFAPLDFSSLRDEWRDENGRRTGARYKLNSTVLIATHNKAFRTQSVNISASGLLVHDPIPKEFNSLLLEIVLIVRQPEGKKNYYFFRGRQVHTIPASSRIVFEAMDKKTKMKIEKLFNELPKAAS